MRADPRGSSPPVRPAPGTRPAACPVRGGFTLVELLVVIGIIALLISILMPALRKAREQANAAVCSSNLRQLMMGFQMFAGEHKGHLPGNWYGNWDPDPQKRDWALGEVTDVTTGPHGGTIFPYVNRSAEVYRCPSLPHEPKNHWGSNGRFDYVVYMLWGGAKLNRIKNESRFQYTDGTLEYVPTPIILEEDPAWGLNLDNPDGNHCNIDRMGHHHWGGGYYASIDGSVHRFLEPVTQDAWSWYALAPSGKWQTMGISVPWGTWNGL